MYGIAFIEKKNYVFFFQNRTGFTKVCINLSLSFYVL